MTFLLSDPMVFVLGGVLRSHGHKTWVAWAIVAAVVIVGISARVLRTYRRRQ